MGVGITITLIIIIVGAISLTYALKLIRDWKIMEQINKNNDLK